MLDPNLLNSQQFSSIGNIVTTGLRLYLMRFKPYLRMAITAHLWLLIPLYGWAKFSALSALLAQLSFHNLVQSPEQFALLQQQVKKHGWSVFITNLLITVMVVSVAFIAFIAVAFLLGIILALIPRIFSVSVPPLPKSNPTDPFAEPVGLAIGLGGIFVLLATAAWVYARYFIAELPLVLECDYKVMRAIKRCRNLTKGSFFLSVGIITVVFSLTCPLSYLIASISSRLMILLLRALQLNFETRRAIVYAFLLMLSLFLNAITMPFWQATKATLYYSLRSRREGFDLQFRALGRPL
ncbi:MAG: hypothetical protein ACAF41_31200 [Leptolyngbya sp. BL-A-14]